MLFDKTFSQLTTTELFQIYRLRAAVFIVAQSRVVQDPDDVDLIAYTWWGPIDLVSAGTGEMRKRYGFIHVDKYDDGTGTYERRRKDSFYAYQKIIKSNGAEGLD